MEHNGNKKDEELKRKSWTNRRVWRRAALHGRSVIEQDSGTVSTCLSLPAAIRTLNDAVDKPDHDLHSHNSTLDWASD